MIKCPGCGSDDMDHYHGEDCDICGYHSCTIECNKCNWKGTFGDLQMDNKTPKPIH